MWQTIKYFLAIFPVIALLSIFLGNPYLSILLILIALVIAIPVTIFAIKDLANETNKIWAITSLCCSSSAAFIGVLVLIVLASEAIK